MESERASHRHNVPAARELRIRQTQAETKLWGVLRGRRLDGLKFRRQHPVGPFVLDFCCPDRRIAIELDGEIHALQKESDAEREEVLRAAGYLVLRFPNDVVLSDLTAVIAAIRAAASEAQPYVPSSAGRSRVW